ncbi:uncharacterized protein MONBRDRAFT_35937 [Monosiga brevicollis MX1]|uniref:Uncharacterized protein n=1 Tax=Monosiga brevicollis TaxID=81824 RepID=A9USQ7_MONBE|nr:uncharacterized protein MONBRDRAFT_35937 [Monosiga brevicollis MX1]EDQ92144.1 predicted protein [Monosiga brevicollis MX1]|eukprot:XP_001743430.1 hypothetical protein [Monosiga brevicollis MX1]
MADDEVVSASAGPAPVPVPAKAASVSQSAPSSNKKKNKKKKDKKKTSAPVTAQVKKVGMMKTAFGDYRRLMRTLGRPKAPGAFHDGVRRADDSMSNLISRHASIHVDKKGFNQFSWHERRHTGHAMDSSEVGPEDNQANKRKTSKSGSQNTPRKRQAG